ncbi:hypothetical protein FT663_03368 [Candidozyma haemuli var. vulneris]|uniref:Manganese/iron superoxide dismutase C-terminal domain-containing protein n=1 Tax=Candidozyma haemuli TaxID=45357 RepID=A0A2V1ANY3_9ASCO|nr:hypothetical protein CXQ85_001744 [[Candida] haemuloni]KAF3989846.1 hypothetical protein FT662_02626 [[Candida] haemuloni var. vulneris]KAF3989990.1 hypothetical protein FT663_03368 [[Candida] haemuloni var. vulneris]PVH19967.1 hypothetical protein CXQ85_001744 [[Candida] haemuloni]
MFRLASATSSALSRGVNRRLVRSVSYLLPSISTLENIKLANKGFEGLFTAETLDQLWFQQGQAIIDKLNSELNSKVIANAPADLAGLITLSFSNPDLQDIYEEASKLHNLQFVMESISPSGANAIGKPDASALLETPTTKTEFTNEPTQAELREWIIDSFGSIAEFRALLLNSAKGIKGNGLTWLVAQATYSETARKASSGISSPETSFNKLAVMNTYNAGTIDDTLRSGQITKLKEQEQAKKEALKKRQQERSEIEGTEVEPEAEVESQASKQDANFLGTIEEAEEAFSFSDRKLMPLLAIDASMKFYVPDYGVFGKAKYLDNVWDCINWDVVATRTPKRFKPSIAFDN